MRQEKFPLTAVWATLDGTNNVTVVAAPPAGEVRLIRRFYAINNVVAGTKTLTLYINDNTTVVPVWKSQATAFAALFNQGVSGVQNERINLLLSTTTQSLEVDLDGTGTAKILAWYETREA